MLPGMAQRTICIFQWAPVQAPSPAWIFLNLHAHMDSMSILTISYSILQGREVVSAIWDIQCSAVTVLRDADLPGSPLWLRKATTQSLACEMQNQQGTRPAGNTCVGFGETQMGQRHRHLEESCCFLQIYYFRSLLFAVCLVHVSDWDGQLLPALGRRRPPEPGSTTQSHRPLLPSAWASLPLAVAMANWAMGAWYLRHDLQLSASRSQFLLVWAFTVRIVYYGLECLKHIH